jgi:hypothetical protein
VHFKEDESLNKKKTFPKNYAVILKIGMNLLSDEKPGKKSKALKKIEGALDDTFKGKILKGLKRFP